MVKKISVLAILIAGLWVYSEAQVKPRPWTASDTSGYISASDLELLSSEIYDRVRQRIDAEVDALLDSLTGTFADGDTLTAVLVRKDGTGSTSAAEIRFYEGRGYSGDNYTSLMGVGAGISANLTFKLPTTAGLTNEILTMGGTNNMFWANDLNVDEIYSTHQVCTGNITCTYLKCAGSSSMPGLVDLYEDTDNGTNYVYLSAPSAIGTNFFLILPDNNGDPGDCLKTDGSGNLYWEAP